MATQTKPIIVSLGGGLVLNKDVFSMQPGEALQLQNFEPNISGGYSKILGTAKYNTNIVPQVSSSSERVVMSAIFNDVVLAARGGTIVRGSSGSGSWTSTITSLGTPTRNYEFRKFNFDGTDKIIITTGTSNPQILDASFSTTNVNATGTSNFKFVEIFKNHLFFAGHSSNEQEISFMGPFQTNDFTSGNGGGTIKVDTEIVGLKVFRENLFIFGKDKIFKLSGTALANFAVAPVTRNIGCIDGGSIQELAGDVVFLAPDGLRTIAGTAISKASSTVTARVASLTIKPLVVPVAAVFSTVNILAAFVLWVLRMYSPRPVGFTSSIDNVAVSFGWKPTWNVVSKKEPLSILTPLNVELSAIRCNSSCRAPTSFWIACLSCPVYTPLADCTASSRIL